MITKILIFVSACITSSRSDIMTVPESVFVVPGEDVSLICRVSYPIKFCRFSFPNGGPEDRINHYSNHNLQMGICRYDFEYGRGGKNGSAKCTLPDSQGIGEVSATIRLREVRRRLTSKPELKTGLEKYAEGDRMDAVCSTAHVQYGSMSFKWYLNDRLLRNDGVDKSELVYGNVVKNYSRKLSREDWLGVLKCKISVVSAGVEQTAESNVVLNVFFAPKFREIINEKEIKNGTAAKIDLFVHANPLPSYELLDNNNEKISNDTSYKLKMQAMGKGVYKFTLSIPTVTQDIEYKLNVYNEIGAETSEIRPHIETSSKIILIISGYVLLSILCILILVSVGIIFQRRCKKIRNTQREGTSRYVDTGKISIELDYSNKMYEGELSSKNAEIKQCSLDSTRTNLTGNEYVVTKHVIPPLNTARNAKTEISNQVENDDTYEMPIQVEYDDTYEMPIQVENDDTYEIPISYNDDDTIYEEPKNYT